MTLLGPVHSLIQLAAKAVASHIPFAVVESYPQPVPEDLQLKIAFWSFPESEEDIRSAGRIESSALKLFHITLPLPYN